MYSIYNQCSDYNEFTEFMIYIYIYIYIMIYIL